MDQKVDNKSEYEENELIFDSDYIKIIENETNLYEEFNKNEFNIRKKMNKNKFNSNTIKRSKSGQNIDFKKYYKQKTINTKNWFICKFNNECKQRADIEENIVQHIRQHIRQHFHNNNKFDNNLNNSENDCFNSCDNKVLNYEKSNDWMVLDEWSLEEEKKSQLCSDVSDNDMLSTSSDTSDVKEVSDSSESCRLSTDYELSDNDISVTDREIISVTDRKINGQTVDCNESKPNTKERFLCNWFACNKEYSRLKCYKSHQNKHLNGHKFCQQIADYSLGFYCYNGIEDYVEIIEENDCEKFFCKYKDCNYCTLWSYQLAIHIRSEHTCFVPFVCDWSQCRKILSSKDMFAHRLSHFGSEIESLYH